MTRRTTMANWDKSTMDSIAGKAWAELTLRDGIRREDAALALKGRALMVWFEEYVRRMADVLGLSTDLVVWGEK